MNRSYVTLRPAPAPDAPSAALPMSDLFVARRRVGVAIACNNCRRKKSRVVFPLLLVLDLKSLLTGNIIPCTSVTECTQSARLVRKEKRSVTMLAVKTVTVAAAAAAATEAIMEMLWSRPLGSSTHYLRSEQ